MLKKLLFAFLLVMTASAFGLEAMAQANETFPVQKSALALTGLPSGALKVREESVPVEIKETLAKIVAEGGSRVKQGNSEVIIWTGNYKNSGGPQMIRNLEGALKNSGWEYEIGEKNSEFVLFSLFRAEPTRRALVGFFVPSEDAFVFALTEMVPSNASFAETENQVKETNGNAQNTNRIDSNSMSLAGKWFRSEGGGHVDWTGKTQYKSGKSYYFEFFPDGTVEYTVERDTLTIMQCRIKGNEKARGKYAINGNSMTLNLGAMSSIGTDSCDAKGNYNKTLPASSVTVPFKLKKMESITRPDNPTLLCFDGNDGETCYERTSK